MAGVSRLDYRQHRLTWRQMNSDLFPWFVTVYRIRRGAAASSSSCIGSAWAQSEADAIVLGKLIVDQELEERHLNKT